MMLSEIEKQFEQKLSQVKERFRGIDNSTKSKSFSSVKKGLVSMIPLGVFDEILISGIKDSKNPLVNIMCFGTLGSKYTLYLFDSYLLVSIADKYLF